MAQGKIRIRSKLILCIPLAVLSVLLGGWAWAQDSTATITDDRGCTGYNCLQVGERSTACDMDELFAALKDWSENWENPNLAYSLESGTITLMFIDDRQRTPAQELIEQAEQLKQQAARLEARGERGRRLIRAYRQCVEETKAATDITIIGSPATNTITVK